jgi:hypothetical protein
MVMGSAFITTFLGFSVHPPLYFLTSFEIYSFFVSIEKLLSAGGPRTAHCYSHFLIITDLGEAIFFETFSRLACNVKFSEFYVLCEVTWTKQLQVQPVDIAE